MHFTFNQIIWSIYLGIGLLVWGFLVCHMLERKRNISIWEALSAMGVMTPSIILYPLIFIMALKATTERK